MANDKYCNTFAFIKNLPYENLIEDCFVPGWTQLHDFFCFKNPYISNWLS